MDSNNNDRSKPFRLARTTVYESPWVNLYLDTVSFPNGRVIEKFHLLDYPNPAVMVVVENTIGQVLFVRICRYTTGQTNWEIPAGGVEPGEDPLTAARREVLEETGYSLRSLRLVHSYYPQNGIGNKVFHVLFGTAGERQQTLDDGEVSGVCWFSRAAVEQKLDQGEITDGGSLVALLLWLRWQGRHSEAIEC